jgi:hypothetical protein
MKHQQSLNNERVALVQAATFSRGFNDRPLTANLKAVCITEQSGLWLRTGDHHRIIIFRASRPCVWGF